MSKDGCTNRDSMTNRKNIKVDKETWRMLKDDKGKYETWAGYFYRIVEGDDE